MQMNDKEIKHFQKNMMDELQKAFVKSMKGKHVPAALVLQTICTFFIERTFSVIDKCKPSDITYEDTVNGILSDCKEVFMACDEANRERKHATLQ